MLNIIKYSQEKGVQTLSIDDLKKWDYTCNENIWVDIYGNPEKESYEILKDIFNFHPLVIEDSLKYIKDSTIHHPKIDDFGDYLFIVFNGIKEEKKSLKYNLFSLSCFLGQNFLVTVHNEPTENTICKNIKFIFTETAFKKGPDYVLNLILDDIVDRYYPILDNLENEIESVEQQIFKEEPNNRILIRILNLKKELIKLRRISSYQKEVLFKLTRGDSPLISLEESIYYRNVYDHLVRVSDTTESYRDYATGLLDSYLSIVNNKLNAIIKFLTMFSTFILPLTLLTGFFGMNFEYLPFHTGELYWIFWFAVILISAGMLLWFKKKKWF